MSAETIDFAPGDDEAVEMTVRMPPEAAHNFTAVLEQLARWHENTHAHTALLVLAITDVPTAAPAELWAKHVRLLSEQFSQNPSSALPILANSLLLLERDDRGRLVPVQVHDRQGQETGAEAAVALQRLREDGKVARARGVEPQAALRELRDRDSRDRDRPTNDKASKRRMEEFRQAVGL
jgi:hypothetical protein